MPIIIPDPGADWVAQSCVRVNQPGTVPHCVVMRKLDNDITPYAVHDASVHVVAGVLQWVYGNGSYFFPHQFELAMKECTARGSCI